MVKAEIKTPNKRKSIANEASAKKVKAENGKPITPKKQGGSPQKPNKNKQIKTENNSDVKDVKPFAGTKQLNKQQQPNKKPENDKANNKSAAESKRKRRSQFSKLTGLVKEKQGSKDPELLKSIQDKISAINTRGELTKTAKKKLGILMKLKTICEEGAEAAAAKSRAKVQAEKAAAGKNKVDKVAAKPQKAVQQKKKQPQAAKVAVQKKQPVKQEEEEDSDAEEEEESDEEGGEEVDSDDDAGEEDSGEEVEGEDDDDDDEEEDDDEEDDDESEEEAPAPKKTKKQQPEQKPREENKNPTIEDLKNKDLVKKGQKRFVLFVGNIAYDTTKQELAEHFQKAGGIVHIRIPTDQKTNKPRGFAYLELKDEVSYEKCLSMHHSQLKSRRINVLYTQGGKKKGDQQKKDIKAKNMKLHALRRQGKLAGSVKETHKRTFRRNKGKLNKQQSEQD
ncbi:nucleolin-like [Anthonomus grandis grandis]|uniref:nucleolin-like n=1 Tax=Anthonomus grandis grandis TaxID=2921223 RepID=UPI00216625F7|nr:nucleolin-like [Anthonomus grandis grandis]